MRKVERGILSRGSMLRLRNIRVHGSLRSQKEFSTAKERHDIMEQGQIRLGR